MNVNCLRRPELSNWLKYIWHFCYYLSVTNFPCVSIRSLCSISWLPNLQKTTATSTVRTAGIALKPDRLHQFKLPHKIVCLWWSDDVIFFQKRNYPVPPFFRWSIPLNKLNSLLRRKVKLNSFKYLKMAVILRIQQMHKLSVRKHLHI